MAENTTRRIRSRKNLEKRSARILAVQCYYSIQQDHAYEKTIDEKILDIIKIYTEEMPESKLSKTDESKLIILVRETFANKADLIEEISKYLAENWRFDRLPKVVQAILLIGAMEIKEGVDKKVVINESVEIAKMFNHSGEAGFVNSVLDKLNFNS